MPRTAVLLVDLQVDFLDSTHGRMSVGADGSRKVIAAADAVISGQAYPGSIVVAIFNAFQPKQIIGNFFRRYAAMAGSPGAELDPRIVLPKDIPTFSKSSPSAFSNPNLHSFLQSLDVDTIVLVGVFAEGCIRATAIAGSALGYTVIAPRDAVATNSNFKLTFCIRSMQNHGVLIPDSINDSPSAT